MQRNKCLVKTRLLIYTVSQKKQDMLLMSIRDDNGSHFLTRDPSIN